MACNKFNEVVVLLAVGPGPVEQIDFPADPDDIVTVSENVVDGKSSVIRTTFKYNDGNVKTFVAVQTFDENGKFQCFWVALLINQIENGSESTK